MDKVAWVLVRDGRLLVARNRGRDLCYLPGGRRGPEESDADVMSREAMEELGVQILPTSMQLIANVTAPRDPVRQHGTIGSASYRCRSRRRRSAAGFAGGHDGELQGATIRSLSSGRTRAL